MSKKDPEKPLKLLEKNYLANYVRDVFMVDRVAGNALIELNKEIIAEQIDKENK